jgi:hypothetical protein
MFGRTPSPWEKRTVQVAGEQVRVRIDRVLDRRRKAGTDRIIHRLTAREV